MHISQMFFFLKLISLAIKEPKGVLSLPSVNMKEATNQEYTKSHCKNSMRAFLHWWVPGGRTKRNVLPDPLFAGTIMT